MYYNIFRLPIICFLQKEKSRCPTLVFILYHNLKEIQTHKWRYTIVCKIIFENDTDF